MTPQTNVLLAMGALAVWIALADYNMVWLLGVTTRESHAIGFFMGTLFLFIGFWLIVIGFGHWQQMAEALKALAHYAKL